MSVKVRKKACKHGMSSLYLDIHYNGIRRYEYLELKIKNNPRNQTEKLEKQERETLAKRIALKRESELLMSTYSLNKAVKKDIDFFEYFEKFITEHRNLVDIRCFITTLNKLKAFAGKERFYTQELTETFLEKFAKHLQKNHNGDTPYNYFKKLKRVINQAFKEKLISVNPAVDIQCPKQKGIEKDVLSIEELKGLISTECPNQQVKQAFLFCCLTGLRFCDVKLLQWKHIKKDVLQLRQAKTGISVSVALSDDARSFLGHRKEPLCYVFMLPTHNGCLKNLRVWTENADIQKHITWHCARHTFGTNLIHFGTDLLVTSKLLGHSSTRYTARYVRVTEALKKEAIKKLPSVL